MSVWSPMILIEFLFAPTVPSAPRPQNLHWIVPSPSVTSTGAPTSSERNVTSSTIPIVKWFLGCSSLRLSYTAMICAGVVSFEPKP